MITSKRDNIVLITKAGKMHYTNMNDAIMCLLNAPTNEPFQAFEDDIDVSYGVRENLIWLRQHRADISICSDDSTITWVRTL